MIHNPKPQTFSPIRAVLGIQLRRGVFSFRKEAAVKSGTQETMKFKRLQRRLKLPMWQAIGLLEAIWQLTARSAPRGDIGKHSNDDIAAWLEYSGDENDLIAALVDSGWLDECSEHRLVVHDWSDHAPNFVKGNVTRHLGGFATVLKGPSPGDTPRDHPTPPSSSVRNLHELDCDIPPDGVFLNGPSPGDTPRDHPKDSPQGIVPPSLAKPSQAKPSQAKSRAAAAETNGHLAITGCGEHLQSAISEWMAYKTERREAYKPAGLKGFLTQVRKLSDAHGESAVADALDLSRANGSQGWTFNVGKKGGPGEPPVVQI